MQTHVPEGFTGLQIGGFPEDYWTSLEISFTKEIYLNLYQLSHVLYLLYVLLKMRIKYQNNFFKVSGEVLKTMFGSTSTLLCTL